MESGQTLYDVEAKLVDKIYAGEFWTYVIFSLVI